MHCCGDPVHDLAANLPFLAPLLTPVVVPVLLWWRRLTRERPPRGSS